MPTKGEAEAGLIWFLGGSTSCDATALEFYNDIKEYIKQLEDKGAKYDAIQADTEKRKDMECPFYGLFEALTGCYMKGRG